MLFVVQFGSRVNVAHGVDVQFQIHFIAPPYALTAHLDVRQDARLYLEIALKKVKESCFHPRRQSNKTAVQIAVLQRDFTGKGMM